MVLFLFCFFSLAPHWKFFADALGRKPLCLIKTESTTTNPKFSFTKLKFGGLWLPPLVVSIYVLCLKKNYGTFKIQVPFLNKTFVPFCYRSAKDS